MLDRDSQMKEVSFRLLGGDFQHHLVSSQHVGSASELVVVDSRRVDLAAGMLDASSQRVSGGTMVPRATSARSRSIIWMLFQSGGMRRSISESGTRSARPLVTSCTSFARSSRVRSCGVTPATIARPRERAPFLRGESNGLSPPPRDLPQVGPLIPDRV
jgi:hypothetical protein